MIGGVILPCEDAKGRIASTTKIGHPRGITEIDSLQGAIGKGRLLGTIGKGNCRSSFQRRCVRIWHKAYAQKAKYEEFFMAGRAPKW